MWFKNRKNTLILIIFLFYSVLIFRFLLNSDYILWGNDLMSNTAYFVTIRESILNEHILPQWNYYSKLGNPIVGDPLNSIYNPLVFVIFLTFTYIPAIKLTYFIFILGSCIAMYLFSRYFSLNRLISIIIALTYASTGYLAARIIAGHLEKIIAYSLIPIFYLFLLKLYKEPSLFLSGIIALLISLLIFSASIYEVFYSLIILLTLIIWTLIKVIYKKETRQNIKIIKYLFLTILLIPLFSAMKTFPMAEVSNVISRNYDPYLGSQNTFTIIYNFFVPSQELINFFKLEKYFVSPYFWWESLAFIGPIFILGIAFTLHLRKKITSNYLYLLLLISTVLFMFSILDNKLNPFYWLFYYVPFIKQFRIPSRVFIYLIPVLMLFGALGLNYIYKKSRRKVIKAAIILVLILNLILTTYVFKNYIYNKSLPRVNPESSFILTDRKSVV